MVSCDRGATGQARTVSPAPLATVQEIPEPPASDEPRTAPPDASVDVPKLPTDAGTVDCGYTPQPSGGIYDEERAGFLGAGCGLAAESPEPWRNVKDVSVVELRLEKKNLILAVVFLDAEQRRVLPIGREVKYDVAMRTRHRGRLKVPETHRDGVFELALPPNARPAKGCTLSIHVTFDTGAGVVEDWVDDWLFSC
jgi:hypothetical protein